jgi:hypothetical protein
MKALQGFLIFMGALAVLAITALIVGYVLALLTPDIRSNMRPVVLSSEAVDSLNSKIDNFKKDATTANSSKIAKNVELVVTEEEINSLIVMTLAEGTLPAREMLVNFNDGYLLAYNAWNFTGFPIKTGVMGSIDVEDGKPKFVIRDFFLGKLPVPDAVDRGVQDLGNILIKLNAPFQELKLEWKEMTISEGQLRLLAATTGNKQ